MDNREDECKRNGCYVEYRPNSGPCKGVTTVDCSYYKDWDLPALKEELSRGNIDYFGSSCPISASAFGAMALEHIKGLERAYQVKCEELNQLRLILKEFEGTNV